MLLWQFQKKKTCSRSLPKIPYANFTGMRTLCEPCANSFLGQIFKTMLSVWVLTGMRNFRITQGVMRNLHFLFKDRVLLFPCSLSSSFLLTSLFQKIIFIFELFFILLICLLYLSISYSMFIFIY